MQNYDLLGQGSTQLITGWSNGKIDCRSIKTGEVLFKDTMSTGISGVVEGDYRSIGKTDIICASCEGEGKFYLESIQHTHQINKLPKSEGTLRQNHCQHLPDLA